MAQPEWELIYATDYSALYRDATGVYPPELQIAQTLDDVDEGDIEATSAYVYRFTLDRQAWVTISEDDGSESRYLVPASIAATYERNLQRKARGEEIPFVERIPHPIHAYTEWFVKSLADVASSVGRSVSEIVDDLCSDDPYRLAHAYDDIGGYHGFANFDGYPQVWTAHEFAEWPERGEKLDEDEREAFTSAYITCALWCGVMTYRHEDDCPCREASENREPYDPDACTCEHDGRPWPETVSYEDDGLDESDLTDDARETLTTDAHSFYESNVKDLRASTLDMEQAGHDFWLTRNHHGAGFWDRKHLGTEADAALDRLTEASHAEGGQDLILGPDGKVSVL